MRVGIVLYPGSNCAEDMKRYFESFHDTCFYIWHKCDNIDDFDFDLLVIPGGFAFGDRHYENATDNYTGVDVVKQKLVAVQYNNEIKDKRYA